MTQGQGALDWGLVGDTADAVHQVGHGNARHAQVVPSFVAVEMRRPLECWAGDIQPGELLRWERKGDLPASARDDLRQTIVKRTRPRAEYFWQQPVGVRMADGWRERLSGADRKRVEQLPLTDIRPLEVWTLRDVKEGLRQPLEQTLAILAKLESVYWVPPSPSESDARRSGTDYGSPVVVTDELRQQTALALELPWLDRVASNDVRLAFPGAAPLTAWLTEQISGHAVHPSMPGLVARLLRATSLTAEAEAREIVEAVVRHRLPRADVTAARRWVDMVVRRYISRNGSGRILADVGDEFSVTRERVRQVCEAFETCVAENHVCTPALDRALLAGARVAPLAVDELDEELRRFIGDGAGFESLMGWARALGMENLPLSCERVRTYVRGEVVEVTMAQAPDTQPWVAAMIRHVSRDSSMFGCTNVLRIAGRLALKEGLAPGQESLETALQATNGFRWLDKDTGWFSLGDSSGCSAASRVRKIMAVAEATVGTDEIAAALASDDMWMYRETSSLGLATPPVHVLRELLKAWPWLRVVQKGRFVPSELFDRSRALSDVEQACMAVILANNGVACRFELKEVVVGKLGLTDVLLAAVLGSSPIFDRLEHGLYALIGRRMGDGAVNAARQRLRQRSGSPEPPPFDLRSDEFVGRVTDASLRNEQYSVPARFHARLVGKRHRVLDEAGAVIGEARVSQSGALAGVNRLFADLSPGDTLRVEVIGEEGLRVRRVSQLATSVEPADQLDAKEESSKWE